jgi:hypothetical protein
MPFKATGFDRGTSPFPEEKACIFIESTREGLAFEGDYLEFEGIDLRPREEVSPDCREVSSRKNHVEVRKYLIILEGYIPF